MCIVSMVHDHYREQFPQWPNPLQPWQPPANLPDSAGALRALTVPTIDLVELRRLIDEFREAVAAAQKLDALMRQPDCVDPEKAKLAQRVEWLEGILERLLPVSRG